MLQAVYNVQYQKNLVLLLLSRPSHRNSYCRYWLHLNYCPCQVIHQGQAQADPVHRNNCFLPKLRTIVLFALISDLPKYLSSLKFAITITATTSTGRSASDISPIMLDLTYVSPANRPGSFGSGNCNVARFFNISLARLWATAWIHFSFRWHIRLRASSSLVFFSQKQSLGGITNLFS